MPRENNQPASQPIVSARIFTETREAVFAAFSEPVRLARWWGPQGFTNTFQEFDFRPGGAWRFTMHGPGGAAYAMDHQFMDIAAPERIVVRHLQQGHDFTLTMTFATQDNGTELTWEMRFADPAEAVKVRDFVLRANEENFDRLAAHLRQSA